MKVSYVVEKKGNLWCVFIHYEGRIKGSGTVQYSNPVKALAVDWANDNSYVKENDDSTVE